MRAHAPWWKGQRGEWYVVGQIVMLALVVSGPRELEGAPPWPFLPGRFSWVLGAALLLAGGCLAWAGGVRLGPSLTPLPFPRSGGSFTDSGVYGALRHPIYGGLMLGAFGWGIVRESWLTLGYASLLFVFLDRKARREERWLLERFPGYADYQRRVSRFVPGVY